MTAFKKASFYLLTSCCVCLLAYWAFSVSPVVTGVYTHIIRRNEHSGKDITTTGKALEYLEHTEGKIREKGRSLECKPYMAIGRGRNITCGVDFSVPKFPLIPKLKEGNLNLAKVLYASTLTMCLAFLGNNESPTFEMEKLNKNCLFYQPSVCDAVKIFAEHVKDKQINFSSKLELFSILKGRDFAESPRPDSCNGCFEFAFSTLIEPADVCKGADILMFMLIFSVPDEHEKRNGMRETWLSPLQNNTVEMRYVFFFGTGWSPLQQNLINCESQRHGDILQMDFKDSYYNMSYKMASGFKWAVDNCPKARFIIRSAVDIYMNIPRILSFAKSQRRNGIFGNCLGGDVPYRAMFHKHTQTQNDYPHDVYGPFCSGSTYLISQESTRTFLKTVSNVPWFNLEDIWVGMVAHKAGIHLKNVVGFNTKLRKKGDKCKLEKNWITIHEVNISSMKHLYEICLKRPPRADHQDILNYARVNRKRN